MNGVEILSENVVYEVDYFEPIIFILLGIGVVSGFLVGYIISHKDLRDGMMGALFGFLLGFSMVFFVYPCTAHTTDTVDHIEYKVTISDDVNFNEFNDKYEILDQEGKIFTVKERSKVGD